MNKTFSAAQAFVKINNEFAGYIRNLQFTENVTRIPVYGLGTVYASEAPAVSMQNTFSCDSFFISFDSPAMEQMLRRKGTLQQVADTLILNENSFSIVIYKKTIVSQDETIKLVTESDPTGEKICMLNPCLLNSNQFQMSDQGLAFNNVSGIYLNPVTTL